VITEGQIFVKEGSYRKLHRRVITIHQGVVCYSRGGDTNGLCKLKSFMKWIKNGKAELIHQPK